MTQCWWEYNDVRDMGGLFCCRCSKRESLFLWFSANSLLQFCRVTLASALPFTQLFSFFFLFFDATPIHLVFKLATCHRPSHPVSSLTVSVFLLRDSFLLSSFRDGTIVHVVSAFHKKIPAVKLSPMRKLTLYEMIWCFFGPGASCLHSGSWQIEHYPLISPLGLWLFPEQLCQYVHVLSCC